MLILIALVTLVYALVYYFYRERFSYWRRKGVPHLKPSIPFGDFSKPWKREPLSVKYANFYETFKNRGEKHGGTFLFSRPIYLPVDPEYVRNILVKDFQHFVSRGMYYNEKDQPISANLFFIDGIRWKNLRAKLTPTFTSGKMKMMFETVLNCTHPLVEEIEKLTKNNGVIDMKNVLARYTTDVIGSCAFGLECNSFEFPNSDFRKYGGRIFEEGIFKSLKMVFAFSFQDYAKKIGFTLIEKEVEDFFTRIVTETYNYRKKNDIHRKDFMQVLIELKDKENDPNEKANTLTMSEIIAQAFAFFVAGFDTSATTLTFCLFELASNLEIQNRLREDIKMVLKKYNGEITYEAIKDMKYMDQVIDETLRKYPVVAFLSRVCTEMYKIPSTDITIDKGTLVFISVLGLHRDPEFYPDPEKFNPERFSDDSGAKIIPGTFLPFGDGPRICIGLRFGLMQVKICLTALLRDFEFSLNSRTKVPIELDLGFITTPKGGVWLNSKKIS